MTWEVRDLSPAISQPFMEFPLSVREGKPTDVKTVSAEGEQKGFFRGIYLVATSTNRSWSINENREKSSLHRCTGLMGDDVN